MSQIDRMAADFDSHHIEGYARAALEAGRDGAFRAPLVSHIEGNLWTGGCINGVTLPEAFRYVVSLYPWEKYRLTEGTSRVEVQMYDSGDIPDSAMLHGLASMVSDLTAHGPTLVHCQAGLNRSGLVGALTLMKQGYSAQRAIELLRSKRHAVVLCNVAFESWLLSEDAS